jgi:hypothetical protein
VVLQSNGQGLQRGFTEGVYGFPIRKHVPQVQGLARRCQPRNVQRNVQRRNTISHAAAAAVVAVAVAAAATTFAAAADTAGTADTAANTAAITPVSAAAAVVPLVVGWRLKHAVAGGRYLKVAVSREPHIKRRAKNVTQRLHV